MGVGTPRDGFGKIVVPNQPEIVLEQEMATREPITSNIFAATIVRAGVRERFQQLQVLLLQITASEKDIRAYGSGEIFRDLITLFETPAEKNPFNDLTLFGTTDPPSHTTVIEETRKALRRVTNAMDVLRRARKLIRDIYSYVDKQVQGTNSEVISREQRTEDLLAWAYRTGGVLNPEITGAQRLSLQTKATPATTNLHGLLNILDDLLLEIETLQNIPAYYRTATNSDTSKIEVPVKTVYVRTGESLERLARRVLGDADKAHLIMEFNDLTPTDIHADDWNGRALSVPYTESVDGERLRDNFVLDSQNGLRVLGRDLTNDIDVDNGDLVLTQYIENLRQAIDNVIQTPVGAIPEQPDYGSNILQLENGSIPQIVGQVVSVEVQRAVMTNPRVSSVEGTTAVREQDAFKVRFQITTVNHLTEAELEANLRLT